MKVSKLKELDPHTITVCKNYILHALELENHHPNCKDLVCNVLNTLNTRVHEVMHGVEPGKYTPVLR